RRRCGWFPSLGLLLLLFLFLLFHLRAVVDVAQRFERTGDDLLAVAQSAHDLDRALARESGFHRYEFGGAVVVEKHPFFVLRLCAGLSWFLTNDERLDRNGHDFRARAGDDVGRRR